MGIAGKSEESAKGATEKQGFCQQACVCYHQVLTPIGHVFMNPKVDDVERLKLSLMLKCSALGADMPDVRQAELRMGL